MKIKNIDLTMVRKLAHEALIQVLQASLVRKIVVGRNSNSV